MTTLRTNLFLVALGLSLLGLVMVYSATYRDFGLHYLIVRSGHLALGVVVFVLVSRVRYTVWRGYAPALYALVLLSLVLVLVPGLGTEVGGARRWFDIGVMGIQPAEFAKLAAVLTLSVAVSRLRPGSGLPWRPLAAVGVLFGLVLAEPDFGTSVVLLSGVAGVILASELRVRDLVLTGGAALVGLAGLMMLAPYRRERFATFLDPWSVADGSGYQLVRSMVAIKNGDLFGAGVGAGGQSASVPETQTDMIFALIGEELGLLGMVVVIGAFIYLALAGFRIAMYAPSAMGRCLAAGLTTMLATQTIFNIGAAMVVLPLAGMTLPFVSYGGSSLLTCFAAVGVLYRIEEDGERARAVTPKRPARGAAERHLGRPATLDRRRRDRGARDPRAVRGG